MPKQLLQAFMCEVWISLSSLISCELHRIQNGSKCTTTSGLAVLAHRQGSSKTTKGRSSCRVYTNRTHIASPWLPFFGPLYLHLCSRLNGLSVVYVLVSTHEPWGAPPSWECLQSILSAPQSLEWQDLYVSAAVFNFSASMIQAAHTSPVGSVRFTLASPLGGFLKLGIPYWGPYFQQGSYNLGSIFGIPHVPKPPQLSRKEGPGAG